jgi:hypothetical protein
VDVGHVCRRLAGKRDDLGGDELDVRKLRFGKACELVGDELELDAGQRATGERELDGERYWSGRTFFRRLTTSTASIRSTSALPVSSSECVRRQPSTPGAPARERQPGRNHPVTGRSPDRKCWVAELAAGGS